MHMNFTDLSVDSVYIGNFEFSPDFPAILWGDVGGNASFSGLGRQADIDFKLENSDTLVIDKMTLLMPVALDTNIGKLSGALRSQSNGAVISLSSGCRSGGFNFTTTMFDDLFQQIGMTAPEISGRGVCEAGGMIDVNLAGQSDALELTISGQVHSNQDWNAPSFTLTAVVEPPRGRFFADNVKQLFLTAGLSPVGRGYSLPLQTGRVGN
ncbi:hypothetical protein [Kordiimonas aquimaris]|uniref:hypothetical protein n=1 Tax=Kordiimonas aquimaris TaxID=707591 RepID=UPI0021D1B3F8|nr:hypothetical protein [Kordiimonas aquimaris]